jgi:perosamine synthetase
LDRRLVKDPLPVAGPWVTDLEVGYAADAARNAWFSNAGEYNQRFERAFAEYVGRAHAVSLPHATAGLHLALLAAGVGPGDEVVVPDATWIATAAPVSYVGATAVFADVDPETWCLTADALREAITPRTTAVIPVGLYGSMPDFDALGAVCAEHGLALIEDAAEALGSETAGRRAGSFGVASVFSFHGSKTLTTGEGGMVVVDDDDVFARIQFLRDHGRRPGDRLFQNEEVAFKYKMSALQAAFGLGQIERIEELVDRKRQIFRWYADRLADAEGVQLNAEPEGTRNSYWMVTALTDLDKFEVMRGLAAERIDSRPFFSPLSSLAAFAGSDAAQRARSRNAVSYDLGRRGVNLPSGYHMTEALADRVVRALARILGR